MYFDAEMLLIYAVSIVSGLLFYRIASRDPRKESAADSCNNVLDSLH